MPQQMKLIDNYIYFYHLDKYCIIPMYPESITDSMNTRFVDTNALGRTAPVFSYINSGPRQVNIELDLHRDLMNDVNINNQSALKAEVVEIGDDYVDVLLKYLQSVALPRYEQYSAGSKSVIPPMVAIRFGNDIFIKGVVNSSVSVTYKKPILYNNKYAWAHVNFTICETDPYSADDVVADGSFRGISKTFKDGIYASTTSFPVITEKEDETVNENTNDTAKKDESKYKNQAILGGGQFDTLTGEKFVDDDHKVTPSFKKNLNKNLMYADDIFTGVIHV